MNHPITNLIRLQNERVPALQRKARRLRQTLYNMNTFIGSDDYSIPKRGTWGPTGYLRTTIHEEITAPNSW